jgi:hypothetical protein
MGTLRGSRVLEVRTNPLQPTQFMIGMEVGLLDEGCIPKASKRICF